MLLGRLHLSRSCVTRVVTAPTYPTLSSQFDANVLGETYSVALMRCLLLCQVDIARSNRIYYTMPGEGGVLTYFKDKGWMFTLRFLGGASACALIVFGLMGVFTLGGLSKSD